MITIIIIVIISAQGGCQEHTPCSIILSRANMESGRLFIIIKTTTFILIRIIITLLMLRPKMHAGFRSLVFTEVMIGDKAQGSSFKRIFELLVFSSAKYSQVLTGYHCNILSNIKLQPYPVSFGSFYFIEVMIGDRAQGSS